MQSEIPGVQIKRLLTHYDDRGSLWEILRSDDIQFRGFGQIYCSTIMPGVVKGFHVHRSQWDNVAVVWGRIKLVLGYVKGFGMGQRLTRQGGGFDVTEEYVLVPGNYMITIPPGVHHGWKNIGEDEAFVINVPSVSYDPKDPDEEREEPHRYYDWGVKDR